MPADFFRNEKLSKRQARFWIGMCEKKAMKLNRKTGRMKDAKDRRRYLRRR